MVKIINNLPPPLLLAEIIFTKESVVSDTIYPHSQSYILKLIQDFKKNSPKDPIPTKLLHKISPNIIESIHEASTQSLNEGIVQSSMKKDIIVYILSKSSLDNNVLSNYRPVSQLSYLSNQGIRKSSF